MDNVWKSSGEIVVCIFLIANLKNVKNV